MLKDRSPVQSSLEFVTLNDLVPEGHLVRKIESSIDFSFIHELAAPLYCADNGRPPLDPTKLFKLLLVGYLFGIRSERQLMREVQVNVAYRWFIGFSLTEKLPDASTLSQNRRRRFNESSVYQDIFNEIVLQAIEQGLVAGEVLYTDSTHIKASANKGRWEKDTVTPLVKDYLQELDAAIEEDRKAHGKKPLRAASHNAPPREVKVSPVDPDAGYMVREGKPTGFFYLDHRTVDGEHNIITDVHVTPATVHDSVPYLSRLDEQCRRFNLQPMAVGLDAGYATASICRGLEQRHIYGVISYRRPTHRKGYFYQREYEYDAEVDQYRCPQGEVLTYRTTSRAGYREYKSDPKVCRHCPVRKRCTRSQTMQKVVIRHVWADAKEKVDRHRLSPWGKAIHKRRQETVERSFADAKQLHGYRYAQFRGLGKVQAQALMVASAQNIKKIAMMKAA